MSYTEEVYARVVEQNPGEPEFHQCGYKFHRWYHMVWMEKLIGEHVENPPAVRAFPEIGFTTEKV